MKTPNRTSRRIGFLLAALAGCPVLAQAPPPSARRDVLAAGAAADGQADCTAVFQKLLDEAGHAGGGVVDVPAGRYRIATGLSIPANVTLQGVFRVAPTPHGRGAAELTGSVLLAYAGRGSADGPPFIRLAGDNAVLSGVAIAYPEWKQSDVPPAPYPPCIYAEGAENVKVGDCLLLNPYEGIKFVRAARHWVRDVTGYPIRRGIYVDECYDIGHIENVHFWPFGVRYNPDDPYCKWVNLEGVAFELARTDWQYVYNTFCFGYGIGYKFSESKTGGANGNFLGLGADSCQRAVVVDQAQAPGLLITNGEFVGRWSSTDAVCIEVGPKAEGKVSLVNCSFWGPIDRCVWMRSPSGHFSAGACHFVNWDNRGVGSPALQLDAGRVIVQGCTFAEEDLHVQVGPDVASAILIGNQAPGGFRVENGAGARTRSGLNEEDPVVWSREARAHYRLAVGKPGDGRCLQGWQGRALEGSRSYRWSSGPVSRLRLPVNMGESCTVQLDVTAPAAAIGPEAGLYLDGKQVVPLVPGRPLVATLPPCASDTLRLELRVKGWVPREVIAGSSDSRTLGVQVFSVTVRGASAGPKVFDANTGVWLLDEAK